MIIKLTGTESACDTTPDTFGRSQLVRLYNSNTTNDFVITYDEVSLVMDVSVDTDANATVLMTHSNADRWGLVKVGDTIKFSTDTGVVNTDVVATVAAVTPTTLEANADVVIANGTCQVSIVPLEANTTLKAGEVMFISKSADSRVSSDNASDVLGTPVTVRG